MFRHPQNPTRPIVEGKKAPEIPLHPYIRYCRRQWQIVRADNPSLPLWQISDVIKENWEKLPESEKDIFQHEYDAEFAEYEKAMRQVSGNAAVATAIKARVKGSKAKAESGGAAVVRAPLEEEDQQPSQLTARRVHAVRFDRNHRLVVDLFNHTTVFDSRVVVPQKRLTLLQRQAQNLELHRNKLEDELKKLEESFTAKKRQMHNSSREFELQLKKVCEEKVEVSEERYAEMVKGWEQKLSSAYSEYSTKKEDVERALAAEREQLAAATPLLYAITMSSPPAPTDSSSSLPS